MLCGAMSDRLLLKVWGRCSEGGSPLALLQAIAEAANEQGNCYLPVADLAAAARMSRENAFRALRRLKADRWVITSRILGQGGTLVFQVNEPKLGRSARPGILSCVSSASGAELRGATEAALVESVSLRPARVAGCHCKRGGWQGDTEAVAVRWHGGRAC